MRLRFIGLNGSMGLHFGQIYRLTMHPWKNGIRVTAPVICPYDSDKAFWQNWAHPDEDVRSVMEAKGRELRAIHIPHEGPIDTNEYAVLRETQQHFPVVKEATSFVTKTNPSGSVQQCERRDIHGPHEWQAEFGAYFDVYCPGNDGKSR